MTVIFFPPSNRPDLLIRFDADDVLLVLNQVWTAHKPKGSKTWYAFTRIDGRHAYLHRRIIGAAEGDEVNHIDGDGLNCTRQNLEVCTHSENMFHAYRLARNATKRTSESRWGVGEKPVRKKLPGGGVRVYVYDRETGERLRSYLE